MLLQKGNILIRNAEAEDAVILAEWWNDGAVMAHPVKQRKKSQEALKKTRTRCIDG